MDENVGNDTATKLNELRNRAERMLRESPKGLKDIPTEDIQNLIQELQVYQIELEMQNAELRMTQLELEESRNKYVDLYDFAPIGYFTLNKYGLITGVNLAGADLFGMERAYLLKRRFSGFVSPEYRDTYFVTSNGCRR